MCSEREGGPGLVVYIPPYSPDLIPIEKMFNLTKSKMRSQYEAAHGYSIRDVFLDCLRTSITPEIACKLFESCYIHVNDAEKAGATR